MINRLRVKNYKSLKDLDLRLRPLTILVGPNNAGKSNIIDVLLVLSEFVNEGAGAIHSRGGFSDIVWNGELKRSVSITLEGQLRYEGKQRRFSYLIELAGGHEHFSLTREEFDIYLDKEPRRLMEQRSTPPGYTLLFDDQGQQRDSAPGFSETALRRFDQPEHHGAVGQFSTNVSGWRDYAPSTALMRAPSEARRDLRLESTGQNLSSVLHTLQTEYPQCFNRIKELLRAVVPELLDLYTPLTEQGRTLVRMIEQGLSMSMPLWALSDGTLHTLGILTNLCAPNPPALMCFEEPENFVHPRVHEVLAEAFKEASQHSQILICTHSPYFLDFFKPEDVVIVEKVRGATEVRRAARQKGLKEALEVLGLGEAWYSGSIGGVP